MVRSIKKLDQEHPEANTRVFVDDTSMYTVRRHGEDIKDVLISALLDFQRLVECLKLKLSPKATITASSDILLEQ